MLVWASLAALLAARAAPSEFPERECCDAVYPLAAVSASISPDTPTPPPSTTTRAGDEKGGVETLNCLLARQLCFEDPSCSPILETIPRVCGPESVSCSTVTVTKCQAALRTLQAFPFFKPTCLCREPLVDHECNSFRNFLFDHPCIFVLKKEKDPYPIDALPTCTHALQVCQKDEACQQIYDYFKTHCKVRDGKCHMEDRELCHEAWTKIRLTPMFGCICPNNHMKKRCERIVSLVNHNPCIALGLRVSLIYPYHTPWLHADRAHDYSREIELFTKETPYHTTRSGQKSEENSTLSFKNTCDKALYSCKEEPACKAALAGVTDYCSSHKCRRHSCMNALQNFYRTVDPAWSLEIAFCLCKKTNNNKDECLVAQELLHPVCAQQPETNVLPTCHSLAQACNQETHCRLGLENYVQACAVDAVSKQCAGPAKACRSAMLGILGTMLRSNCACKGTDFSQLYDCMGWQRVLWFNPCVVESQRDFHAKKMEGLTWNGNNKTRVVGVMSGGGQPTWGTTSGSASPGTTESKQTTTQRTTLAQTTHPSTVPSTSTTTTTTTPSTTSTTTTTTTPSTTTPTTTTTTTTTTTERPTPPSRYCVFQKPDQDDQIIADNEGKRLYREGEPDCSDVCQCQDGSLTCNTICVERHPCKTDFAFYNHAAPAYQAYRGRCLCYSGKFICMRPPPDTYDVPQGVFLFLGYSDADEARLKPLIKMQVEDAVASLHKLLRVHVKPKTPCMLALYNISSNTENVILVAKLADNNSTLTQNQMSPSLLNKQKEECLGPLQEISDMINSQDPIVHSHLLLSIFKMAEVEVKYPPGSNGGANRPQLFIVLGLFVSRYLLVSITS